MPKRQPPKPRKRTAPAKSSGAPPRLTPQQDKFIREYLIDLHGTKAAIRAGYAEGSAEVAASRLLRQAKIRRVVTVALEARAAKTEITQDRVLRELEHLAFSNVDDYAVSPDGRLVPAEGRPKEVMRAVSSVKYRTRGTGDNVVREVEFKLWDKPGTVKLAGRHTGLFPNEVKLEVGEETLAGILGRAAARGLNGKK